MDYKIHLHSSQIQICHPLFSQKPLTKRREAFINFLSTLLPFGQ